MDGCLTLAGNIPSAREEPGEEIALIRLAQQGERTAFDALVRQYDQQVLRLILKIVPSPDQAPPSSRTLKKIWCEPADRVEVEKAA